MNTTRYCLTMDTDWVPPFVLDYVLSLLAAHPVPVTVFCTSPYPLRDLPRVEWGLHPNILAGSSHGATPKACVDAVSAFVPHARSARSHSFGWCSGCPGWLRSHGITHDASLFRPMQPDLHPVLENGLIRVPTWWGDRMHLTQGGSATRFAPDGLHTPGLKTLLFHPLHIYLNNPELDVWRTRYGDRPLFSLTEEELTPFRKNGDGARTLLLAALEFLADRPTCLVHELSVETPA